MVQITPEQLKALAQSEDRCVHLRDPRTDKVYLLVENPPTPEADESHVEYMRQGLVEAQEAIAQGEVVPWDKEAFLSEMHRRRGDR